MFGIPVGLATMICMRPVNARILPLVALLVLVGCAGPFPTSRGFTIRAELGPDHPGYWTTLQVRWLGTASYLIQLGDVAVLTDPFFTYHSLLKVGLGTIESDAELVHRKIRPLPTADAIFIGHSHYDHVLGVPNTLKHDGWQKVPVYGSQTTKHILCGYGENLACVNYKPTVADGAWQPVAEGLEYKAIIAEHAPHVRNALFTLNIFPGRLERCLEHRPTRAAEFPVGETYAYVFRLSNHHAAIRQDQQREFVIYFAGAATSVSAGIPDESVRAVDVAILCVPGWENVDGYPDKFIERLSPRNILLSHYDDFFQEWSCIRQVVPLANFEGFLERAKRSTHYLGFERIVAPDVDELLHFRKP